MRLFVALTTVAMLMSPITVHAAAIAELAGWTYRGMVTVKAVPQPDPVPPHSASGDAEITLSLNKPGLATMWSGNRAAWPIHSAARCRALWFLSASPRRDDSASTKPAPVPFVSRP